MTRPLYPARDSMRVAAGISAARFIAATVIVGACILGPDALVAWVMG